MCHLRAEKVPKIPVFDVEVQGCADDADLLIVGFQAVRTATCIRPWKR